MGAHAQLQSQVLPPPYDSVTMHFVSPPELGRIRLFSENEHVSEFVHRTGCPPWELSGFRHWRAFTDGNYVCKLSGLGTGEQALRTAYALQKPMLDSGKGDTFLDKEESCRCCSVPKEKGSGSWHRAFLGGSAAWGGLWRMDV